MADSSEIIEFYKQAGSSKPVELQQDTAPSDVVETESLLESGVVPEDPFAKFLFTLNKNLKDKQQQIAAIKTELPESAEIIENNSEESIDPFGNFIDKLQSVIQDKKEQAIKETTIKFINQLKDDKQEEEPEKSVIEEQPVEVVSTVEEATPLLDPISVESEETIIQPTKEKVVNQKEQLYIKELKAASQTQKAPKKATKPNDIKTLINQQVEAQTSKILEEVKAYAKRILDLGGGGGSVAQQFANGGTMNGTLNVTGQYLSGGQDLASIFSGGGGGSSDRLVSGSSSLILNSDGSLQFPSNIIRSQDDAEIILESENASLSAFTQIALTPHGFFAYDDAGDSIAFDSVSNTIVFKTLDNYTWTLDDQGNIIGPSGTLTVSGSINTTGNILSGGIDLADIFLTQETDSQTLTYTPSSYQLSISNGNTVSLASLSSVSPDLSFLSVSGNWNSTYTTVSTNSGNWNEAYTISTVYANNSASYATTSFVNTNFFNLTGGTISGPVRVNNNVSIFGNLTATGTTTFANTVFSVTSALSVVHVGSGPALYVGNNGDGDIASFYDLDQGIEVLHVGGNNGTFPNVGVKTSSPNVDFTVNGQISANNIIWDANGNSNNWNNAYTTVATNSATWVTDSYTVQIELPDNKEYIFDARALYNYTLSAIHFYAVSGTGNLSLEINNSIIPEFDQRTISNTLSTVYLTTNNVVSSNQTFTAMISNNSFMSDLIVDVIYTR